MKRIQSVLFGPEAVMVAIALGVHAVCAAHATGAGSDLLLMEQLVWTVPAAATALAFATMQLQPAAGWTWLARANVAALVGSGIIAVRVIEGFGTGAKGQDAAFILAMVLAVMVAGLGTAIAGATILARTKPVVGEWFREHPLLGAVVTLAASAPIGMILGLITATLGGVLLGLWAALSS